MKTSARICFGFGVFILSLSVINIITADQISPSLERAEVLSSLSAVGLLLVAYLWSEFTPVKAKKKNLVGEVGFKLAENLVENIKFELAWGSNLILTATAASTILVYWNNQVIMRRGILSEDIFKPGPICIKSQNNSKLISLHKKSLYPDAKEFDAVVKDLPAIIVYPLNSTGIVIVGGWSERCFTKSDEIWIKGWSERLKELLVVTSQ